ncbi:NifB/NifX family molybdenum-iron cluster-binding protein [Fundidesulfovibrio terrae]|uniref:NifB/NifX family molybdenum-iron cluster-binding protein n=1 Tax=Fundidesulfovibrio terrae TaxID=2922866 RepID=UPI001FAF4288|nr:NifB/NifX family molybdenum-iron cluster-binding protein [Fundidesulfovibrio terrae]
METTIVAVPSVMPGGLDSQVGEHFGHCEIYTLVEVGVSEVVSVATLPNVPHEHGGCMAPVQHLAGRGVKALIAGGMGMRPLMGFKQLGIDVYHGGNAASVAQAVQAFLDGKLQRFSTEFTCRGCS